MSASKIDGNTFPGVNGSSSKTGWKANAWKKQKLSEILHKNTNTVCFYDCSETYTYGHWLTPETHHLAILIVPNCT